MNIAGALDIFVFLRLVLQPIIFAPCSCGDFIPMSFITLIPQILVRG